MNNKENISSLLSGFYAGVLSGDELKRLGMCMADKRYATDIADWLRREWIDGVHTADDASVPGEEMLARIRAAIAEKERSNRQQTARPDIGHRHLWTVMRYAAVFALAFGLSRIEWGKARVAVPEAVSAAVFNEVLVPYGSKTVIVLADSSRIWLNAGARLKYPTLFDATRREVFLQGEGYFEVAKDVQRPFYVSTNGMNIKVLGTKFNLMANADDRSIEATLVEGAIEVLGVRDEQQGGNLRLKPGQKLTLQKDNNSYSVAQVADDAMMIPKENDTRVRITKAVLSDDTDLSQSTAWTENKLIFTRERFADVKVKLERWYGVTIEVKDREILDYRFTGTFEKQTVEQAMDAFSRASSCRFKIVKDKVYVSRL